MVYLSMLSGFFLRLGLVTVAVDRPKVVIIVGAAVGQGNNVVNLVRFSDPAEPDAVVATAEVLVALQDPLTDAAPGPATSAGPLAGGPGLGLLGSQLGVSVAVAIGVAVQRSAALSSARSLRPQRHGAPLK
jgi:hypothetical protein